MTQMFAEDGERISVTVIEAGPCPVTAVREPERDGYRAVQLAFGETRERGSRSRSSVTSRRRARRRCARWSSSGPLLGRRRAGAQDRRQRHRRAFEKGERVKVRGRSKGKGFQGTIRRHRFHRGPVSHGSHNVRAPGSIGASATPARVIKGVRMPGQMGNRRVTQRGLEVVDVDAERNLLIVRGAVPGPTGALVEVRARSRGVSPSRSRKREAQRRRSWRAGNVDLPSEIFGEPFHEALVYEAARAEQLARRRGTASTKTRAEVRGGGAKPWRQKGTGRARAGSIRAPHWTGGGAAFGPAPRGYTVKVNRKARRRALRAALSLHAEREIDRRRGRRRVRRAFDAQGGRCARRLGRRAPRARAAGRRGRDLRKVVSQHRARDGAAGDGRRRGRRASVPPRWSSRRPRSTRSRALPPAAPRERRGGGE